MDIRFSFTYHVQVATFYFMNVATLKKKESDTKNYNELVKEKYDFDEKPSVDDKYEEQIVMDILNNVLYDHIKTEEPYVELTVQDAETIHGEITAK